MEKLTHLPATAYRLGMRVQIDMPNMSVRYGTIWNITETELNTTGYKPCCGPIRYCKPILRPLNSITQDEATEVVRLGFGYDKACITRIALAIDLEGGKLMLLTDEPDSLLGNGCIWLTAHSITASYTENKDLPRSVDARAIYDYLEQQHIDYRGWLAQGLAVDAGTI